jgi:hypothetical protein
MKDIMAHLLSPGVLAPGVLVRHPQRPDWGLGQVQSAIGDRVTINFEHAGKQLVLVNIVTLDIVIQPGNPDFS